MSPRWTSSPALFRPRAMGRTRGVTAIAHDANTDAPRRPLRIAIISGKGGVGKTNIAVNLGLQLGAQGVRVVLVDLDFGLANADLLLDVQPRLTVLDLLAGRCTPDEAAQPVGHGMRLIAGCSATRRALSPSTADLVRLGDQLRQVNGDVVIYDCGAGVSSSVTVPARQADLLLVVTTPEPAARADAYAAIKICKQEGYSSMVRVLVNMADSRAEAKATSRRIQRACEKFMNYPIADAGYILHDTHVELAVRKGVPVVKSFPRCSASVCMTAISARLMNVVAPERAGSGWFDRMVQMFT